MWSHESLSKQPTSAVVLLVPRLPCSGTQICIHGESLVSFSHEHDVHVIEIGPEFLE